MKLQFRETTPQDAPEVAAFLQRIFELDPAVPLISPPHMQWKYWEPRSVWPGSRGFVLTREDAIVAHGTVVPLSCISGQRQLRMAHLIDWAADPKCVGSGVNVLKHIGRLVDAIVVVGGSEMTLKVLPALGFKKWGEVTQYVRPVRPLRRLAGQRFGLRLAAQFSRSLLWALQAPSPQTSGLTATRITPQQLPSQAIPWPRTSGGTTIFERTADLFDYLLKCPVTPIELYSCAKGGEVRGYFLLAYAPGQTRIADFYIDSDNPRDWQALINQAVSQATQNRQAAEVVSVGSDAVTHRALLDCGFRPRTIFPLHVQPGKGVELAAEPVRFHMIDSDAAYHHNNKNTFWA